MNRRRRAQRVAGVLAGCAVCAALAGAAAVLPPTPPRAVRASKAPVAAFVPDDNRGFTFDLPARTAGGDATGAERAVAVTCGFYGRGNVEKRIIVYREAPSPSLLGVAVRDRWAIAGQCAAAGPTSPSPVVVVPVAPRRRGAGSVLVVAWARRADGRWAQLERYSVLVQRTGTMYQFGDFRRSHLDGASAYVRPLGNSSANSGSPTF